jgi:5,10-methylenetetrahydromethanopterin reductase
VSVDLWTQASSDRAGAAAASAKQAEQEGWNGVTFSDTQCLRLDVYVALASASLATSSINIGTFVTNPWTRHPAVTASAIASIQMESLGRASLGIGRGDSSLAYLGLAPASVDEFSRYVGIVQSYLRGESVPMDVVGRGGSSIGPDLPLGKRPETSRLEWLPDVQHLVKVPVWVTAAGPKVMQVGATLADRVILAVGADVERIRFGIELIRSVNPIVSIGAFINVIAHDDGEEAYALAAKGIAGLARWSGMHGISALPADPVQTEVFEAIGGRYDMTRHGDAQGNVAVVTPEFASRFGIIGPSSYCIERMLSIAELGIDRFHVQQALPIGSEGPLELESARRQSNETFLSAVADEVRHYGRSIA